MTIQGRVFSAIMFLAAVSHAETALAATRYVGANETYTTIQSAIDASTNGDTIIVRDGTYTGAGNRNISFSGKGIHLKSQNGPEHSLIDAERSGRALVFTGGEQNNAIVEGFTISGGYVSGSTWGTGSGGGIYISNSSSPTIRNNVITGNEAAGWGYGGGITVNGGSPLLANNTFSGNTAERGPAISIGGHIQMYNNIMWGNHSSSINHQIDLGGTITIHYCIIEGGRSGIWTRGLSTINSTVLLDLDPLFVDASIGKYRLQSQYGRWSRAAGTWVFDTTTSPAIAAGDPSFDYSREPMPNGARINMGAFGNTPTASKFPGWKLTITSDPIEGIFLEGGYPGISGYHTFVAPGEWVEMIAPEVVLVDGATLFFRRWRIGQNEMAEGVSVVSTAINSETTLTAVYEIKKHPLSVTSKTVDDVPLYGVQISGTRSGNTPYMIQCDDQETASLLAPDTVRSDGVLQKFVRWKIDGVPQPVGSRDITLLMDDEKSAVAIYEIQKWILNVQSVPAGVFIDGDRPGVTEFTADCHDQEFIMLLAPASIVDQGIRYNFFRWTIDETEQPDEEVSVQVVVDDSKSIVAVYQIETHKLTVTSAPLSEISMAGDKPGVTDYQVPCDDQDLVTLLAPVTAHVEGIRHDFVRWMLDSQPQEHGELSLAIVMDSDHLAEAVFKVVRLLTVQSDPPGAEISDDRPGITPYTAECNDGQLIRLTAAVSLKQDALAYDFKYWMLYGEEQPLGQTTVEVTMHSDITLVAFYETTQHALTVHSTPITGIGITGDRPGQTSYTASVGHCETITISAPITFAAPEVHYGFIRWLLDDEPQLSGETAIELTFESAHTLVAVYGQIIYVDPSDPTAFATIQSAIDAASDGDVVLVRDGIYRGDGNRDISYNGKQILVKSENGPANCIIDCQGTPESPARGFFFSGGNINENSILQGITVTNGYSIDNGGAVRVSNSASPVINGCVFAENSAHDNGGALWSSGGSAAIINCTFTDNVAQTGHGGAIYSEVGASLTISGCTMIRNAAAKSGGAAYFTDGSPVMTSNTFTGNVAWTGNGGGICLAATTRAALSDNTFSGNMADDYGGGVCSGGQKPVFTGNTLSSNLASYGGGIDCRSSDDASIIDNALNDNDADYGGGMYLKDLGGAMTGNIVARNHANGYGGGLHLRSCSLAMTGDRVEANTASQTTSSAGGGIFLEADSDSWMLNCIIAGNAGRYGGGICVDGSAPTIINCTISDNSALAYAPGWDSAGGGICFRGGCFLPLIKDSIIGPNVTDGDGEEIVLRNCSAISIRYSNVVTDPFIEDGSAILWGDGVISVDPLFASAGDYHLSSMHGRWDPAAGGGQGDWVADQVTSPCIDAGHPVSVFDAEPEPNGGRINMGAYGNTPEASRSASPQRILTVRSSPFEGVSISGDKAGVTNYEAPCGEGENVSLAAPAVVEQHSGLTTDNVTNYDLTCYEGDSVSLSAPAAVTQGSATYRFASWSIDGEPGSVRQAEIVIQMDTNHMAEAIYLLVGDANGDCRVDILDLLFVRNRLLKDVSTDDHWQADVNNDGKINILDLITVRNNLNATCGQQ